MADRVVAAYFLDEEIERGNENVPRRQLRDTINPFHISTEDFQKLFRLPQEGVIYLVDILSRQMIQPSRSTGIPVHLRILCALNFFATGSHQRRVGQDYLHAMSQSEVSKSVTSVSDAINRHLLFTWVKFPVSQLQKQRVKERFMEKTGFPGVVGAVDGMHVAIVPPEKDREYMFINSKGFHSKNIQVVSDYDLKILSINARHGGGSHDSHIWRSSQLCLHMGRCYEEDQNNWLLGDSAYPLQPWLMTPIHNPPANSPEERYNSSHSSARCCVEKCISLWKAWFKCLGKDRTLHYTPERAGIIINACSVLHNMAIHYCVPQPEFVMEELDVIVEDIDPSMEGLATRRRIIEQHFAYSRETRATSKQMEMMLEYMEEHPDFANGRVGGAFAKSRMNSMWEELAARLNAVGGGPSKPPQKWQKTWVDWKSNTKKKLSRLTMSQVGAEGGPPTGVALTKVEERLIDLFGTPTEADLTMTEAEVPPENVAEVITVFSKEETMEDHEEEYVAGPSVPRKRKRGHLIEVVVEVEERRLQIQEKRLAVEQDKLEVMRSVAENTSHLLEDSRRRTSAFESIASSLQELVGGIKKMIEK